MGASAWFYGAGTMLSTIFLIAAVAGGTVLVCQFLLTVMGLGHDGLDVGGLEAIEVALDHGDVPGVRQRRFGDVLIHEWYACLQ